MKQTEQYITTMRRVKKALLYTNPITWVFGVGFVLGLFGKQVVEEVKTYAEDLEN